MEKQKRGYTLLFYGILLVYILIMLDLLFFQRASLASLISGDYVPFRSVNLIPLAGILDFISIGHMGVFILNVVGNVAVFIPMGIYVAALGKDKGILSGTLLVALTSLIIEVGQWILAVGATDVDDILLNTLGGFIGILCYKGIRSLLRSEAKAQRLVAALSALVGIPVLALRLITR